MYFCGIYGNFSFFVSDFIDLEKSLCFSSWILLFIVQSLSWVWLFVTPCTCSTPGFPVLHCLLEFAETNVHWVSDAIQPSYSLSPPSLPAFSFPRIMVSSNESALPIRWPKYWRVSISPSKEYSEFISFRIDWFDILAVQGTLRVFSSTTVWKQFSGTQPSLWSNVHIHTWLLEKP